MQFSTVATIAAVAAVASAASNVTTATATDQSTTLVTITSCESHVCSETESPAWVSTATVTISDVVTEYTTWCPIPTEEPTAEPTEEPTYAPNTTVTTSAETSTHDVTSYTGAAVKALPAAGALFAGAAALLL